MAGENNRNAYAGRNVETLFRNSINDYPSILESIQKYFKLEGQFLHAIGGGIHGEKADVKLGFASGHFIDVNIKAYKGTGFNQLTRTTVTKFCERFSLDEYMEADLKNLIIEKSKHTKSALFNENAIGRWSNIVRKNAKAFLQWGFSYKASREIIALYDRDTSVFRIYPMSDVLNKLSIDVNFTKGGFNIGNCVSFQRKGGNGSLSKTIPKHDIKHPGNNVQLKLKVHKFIDAMEGVKIGQYTI